MMRMDAAIQAVLDSYEARYAKESLLMRTEPMEKVMARRDEFLLPVGAETGTVLNLLIKGAKAASILEIGTSYGYSALFLGEAARATGGKLTTVELSPEKSRQARAAVEAAGLAAHVDFQVGSALEVLPRLAGPFDFVLIDLWKDLYVPCLDLIYGKLKPGALVAADNMTYPDSARDDARAYQRRVRELEFDSVLLPVGSGVELSRRR
jgi:predicted O-methyltransferase YrrM